MQTNLMSQLIMSNLSEDSNSIDGNLQEILKVTRHHLGMDVAFISKFSEDKRLFKVVDAKEGIDTVKVGEYDPIEETYCKKIVDGDLAGIINDTASNKVTNALSVTQKLKIGSYLGVPIKLPSGEVYGTLCCYKNSPDPSLMERDLAFLSAFSDLSSKLIDNNLKANNSHNVLKQKIISILKPELLAIHYQPIYDLNLGAVVGFESLTRFLIEPYRTPDVWFNEAAQVGLGEKLELLAIENAIKGFKQIPDGLYISLNVSPEYIINGSVERLLQHAPAHRIVLEVTEHAPVSDYEDFRRALEPLNRKGMRLAIDDAGAGYASFQHILELNADIIKLDISLIRDIHVDLKRRALATALIAFAEEIGCIVMAEGVEYEAELITLKNLGVNKVQGYFIGRPVPLEEAVSLRITL